MTYLKLQTTRFFIFLALFSISTTSSYAINNCNLHLRTGNSRLVHSNLADNAKFTPDETKVLTIIRAYDNSTHDVLAINSLKTKSENYLMIDPYPNRVYSGVEIKISNDSKFASFQPPKKFKANPYIYDVQLGKLIEIPQLHKAENLVFSNNNLWLASKIPGNKLGLYNTNSKRFIEFEMNTDEFEFMFIGDSNKILIFKSLENPEIIEIETLKKIKLNVPFNPKSIHTQSFKNTDHILFNYGKINASNQNVFVHFDITRNLQTNHELSEFDSFQLLPDGSNLFISNNSKAFIYNLNTKNKSEISNSFFGAWAASEDGKLLLTLNKDQRIQIYNIIENKTSFFTPEPNSEITNFSFLKNSNEIQIQYMVNNKRYLAIANLENNQIKKWQTPHDSVPLFSSTKNKVLFYFPDYAYFKGGTVTVHDLSEANIQSLVSKAKPESYYTKLGTPGQINIKNQINEIFTYFESGKYLNNKRLTQKILLNVLSKSTDLYESIILRYPDLGTEGFFARRSFDNPTPLWLNSVRRYLNYFSIVRAKSTGILDSMKFLYPISNYFKNLSFDEIYYFGDAITEGLAEAASLNEFKGIFQSMLYKFAEENVNRLFWSPTKQITDVTFLRKPYEIQPIILGSQPIEGKSTIMNPYGFYSSNLPKIIIPKNAKVGDVILKDHTIEWIMNGKPYKAILNIKVTGESLDAVAPKIRNIDLNKLTKDGKLTGLIVFGSNLTGEFESSLEAYKTYFIKNGFKFDKRSTVDDNFKQTFKDMIESGEVDYFIKEAHSDGDERNVFRINKEGRVYRAVRNVRKGFDEVVYIVIPNKSYSNYTSPRHSILISNDEYGNWLQTRFKNGKGEFIMLNTSCWSISKAAQEIEKVLDKKFIDISSTTPVSMFENKADNAEYQLLNDFRTGKTMLEIEENLKRNAENYHGTGNNFILYHMQEFKKFVLENNRPALDIDVVLIGPEGKPINIDE